MMRISRRVRWRILLAATLMLGAAYLVKALLETRTVAVKVGNRLCEHATLAPFDITLTPRGSTVTLDGMVASNRKRLAICAVAKGTPGVEKIIDRLTVASPIRPFRVCFLSFLELQCEKTSEDFSIDFRRPYCVHTARGQTVLPRLPERVEKPGLNRPGK
jgi:BON domain